MLVIWKTELTYLETQLVMIPADAEILCAKMQHGIVTIWYRCDPTFHKKARTIVICPTGGEAPPPEMSKYLGTVLVAYDSLVFHIFERKY